MSTATLQRRPLVRKILEMIDQSIHQCILIVSIGRVDYHTCFLIHYNKVLIFIYYLNRNVLRNEFNLAHGFR